MEGAAGGRLEKLRGTESRLRSRNAVSGDGSLGGGKKGVLGGRPGLSWGGGRTGVGVVRYSWCWGGGELKVCLTAVQ